MGNGLDSKLAALALAGVFAVGGTIVRAQPAAPGGGLEIAGVAIGMSTAEAVARLRAGGWTVRRGAGLTWQEAVDQEVARQRGSNQMSHATPDQGAVIASKGDERLGVEVRPSARGGETERVDYSAPYGGRSVMEMGKALFDRYGPSSKGRASVAGFLLTWCVPKVCGPAAMTLTADTGGSENRLALHLSWSLNQHLAYDRMMGEAVRSRVGGAKSSF